MLLNFLKIFTLSTLCSQFCDILKSASDKEWSIREKEIYFVRLSHRRHRFGSDTCHLAHPSHLKLLWPLSERICIRRHEGEWYPRLRDVCRSSSHGECLLCFQKNDRFLFRGICGAVHRFHKFFLGVHLFCHCHLTFHLSQECDFCRNRTFLLPQSSHCFSLFDVPYGGIFPAQCLRWAKRNES